MEIIRRLLGRLFRRRVLDAARRGDVDALRKYARGLGLGVLRGDGANDVLTPLHLASAAGQTAAVRFLLDAAVACDPNLARLNHFSPLHAAAMNGHADVCELLLRAGACPDAQTAPQRYTPLHSAAYAGHLDCIRVLLERGASRLERNYHGETPGDTARRQRQQQAALLLDETRD